MTDTVVQSADLTTPADAPPLASWSRRVVAALLDGAILSGATWLLLGSDGIAPTFQPTFGDDAATVPWYTNGWLVVLSVGMLLLQAWTGATPGKRVAGVAVVRDTDGLPAGAGVTVGRVLAHVIDSLFLIGYLRPLWNAKKQTFADSIVGTLVVQTREPPAHPWFARFRHEPSAVGSTVVSCAAGVACVLGVGFSVTGSSWGGSWETPLPCTDDGTVAAPTAVAQAARAGGRMTQTRLWVSREVDDQVDRALRITWSAQTAEQVEDVRFETDVRRADGSVIVETQDAIVVGWGPDESVTFDPAEVPAEDLENAGPGWAAQTRLVVDGEVVGACTLDSADWDAAAAPPLP